LRQAYWQSIEIHVDASTELDFDAARTL